MRYHYEYAAYTDNLNYGRMLLGRAPSRSSAQRIGHAAGKGAFTVERFRVYDNENK